VDDVTIDSLDLAGHVDEALQVQALAFGLTAEEVAVRRQIVMRHAHQPGAVAFGAFAGDRLVGFGYGMPNDRGQWWSTVIEPYLERAGNAHWLDDSFSVTELHVLPAYQGLGIGRRLITTLCADVAQPRSILSAIDHETPARHLYRSLGYVDLARRVMFPNTALPYAVMGARLPLRARR
jgi:ribosomal protein S18 acetylase RimI-like enzyme